MTGTDDFSRGAPPDSAGDRAALIAQELPYLRRHARALTGSQQLGDHAAAATLEAILHDGDLLDAGLRPRVALLDVFYRIRAASGATMGSWEPGTPEALAERHLARLTPLSREALLLSTIEELRFDEIARVMSIEQAEAERLVATAKREMSATVAGRLLVIEDETLIAMDIESIVTQMGHGVTGIARTRDQAVRLAARERPDLILADIQLADGSSGIDAVSDIRAEAGEIPVIFVTAYPERLLTGARPEPAFLITKPYSDAQLQSAVSQAMFFSSTATLTG